MAVSDRPWSDFSQADYTPQQWARACLIDTGQGAEDSKDRYKLPVREPGGTVNRNAIHAAAGRLNQTDASPEAKAAAARKLASMYRDMGEEAPPHLMMMAARASDEPPRAPIEHRSSEVAEVNSPQRIITVIAAPYERPAMVQYRGETWTEIFERSAFDSLNTTSPTRVRANREHNRSLTVGKAVKFYPSHQLGLVADVKIAQTPRGDETLTLAMEDCLSTSVGFGVLNQHQLLDRRTMTRRIKTAFLDHLAFVESPAYEDAKVLSVRDPANTPDAVLPRLVTPNIDQLIADDIVRWASERSAAQFGA